MSVAFFCFMNSFSTFFFFFSVSALPRNFDLLALVGTDRFGLRHYYEFPFDQMISKEPSNGTIIIYSDDLNESMVNQSISAVAIIRHSLYNFQNASHHDASHFLCSGIPHGPFFSITNIVDSVMCE